MKNGSSQTSHSILHSVRLLVINVTACLITMCPLNLWTDPSVTKILTRDFFFVLVFSSILFRFCDVTLECSDVRCGGDPLGLLRQPLFVDYSDLVRLVIVKWNRRSIYLCFLLLCGDVEPNLGPNACSICGVNVFDDGRAVCCDLCDMWVHVSCDPSLSDSLCDDMVQQPSEDHWYCSVCMSNCSHSSECSTEESGNFILYMFECSEYLT